MFHSKEEIDNVNRTIPVKNATLIFSCLFDGSLVESDTKIHTGNPIIFLQNALEIP